MKLLKGLLLFSLVFIVSEASQDKPKVQIGIKKRIEGCTKKARSGDSVQVHYKGTLKDGSEFDSSYTRGTPFPFTLGTNQVIKGWDQGLLGMCEGEKRRLVIPPELGYGARGAGEKIPPNSVLVFEVEMIKIDRKTEL